MSEQINVVVEDKNLFKSKKAITRFKKDLKKNTDQSLLEPSKYLKDGYSYTTHREGNNIIVDIVTSKEYQYKELLKKKEELLQKQTEIQEQNKKDLRQRLRKKIQGMKNNRSTENTQRISKLKKNVPKKLFKKYVTASTGFGGNIPPPDEILENPQQYVEQIQFFMDESFNMNSKISSYYKALAEELGIQPLPRRTKEVPVSFEQPTDKANNSATESETDSEAENHQYCGNPNHKHIEV